MADFSYHEQNYITKAYVQCSQIFSIKSGTHTQNTHKVNIHTVDSVDGLLKTKVSGYFSQSSYEN